MQASVDQPLSEPGLAWDSRFLCGHAGMDREHQAFAEDVAEMLRCDAPSFAAALDRFAEHLEAHFGLEERLIEQYRLPAGTCHVEEHNKVRTSLREVQALAAQGDFGIGRDFAQALADWFPGHADTMDSSLATWVARKSQGGTPVVFRRALRGTAQVPG